MRLSILADNLREIYAGAHARSLTTPLVSDFSGTQIYLSSSGWGRFWKFFFNIAALFVGPHFESEKLSKAIAKTRNAFVRHCAMARESMNAYKVYLVKKSLGISLDEKKYHRIRKRLNVWNNATGPFIKFCYNSKKIQSYAAEFFNQRKTGSFEELCSFSLFQHLVELEGYLHAPLPLEFFYKLAAGIELKPKEANSLKTWIEEHNNKSSPLSIRPFHLALKSFVEITKAAIVADLKNWF